MKAAHRPTKRTERVNTAKEQPYILPEPLKSMLFDDVVRIIGELSIEEGEGGLSARMVLRCKRDGDIAGAMSAAKPIIQAMVRGLESGDGVLRFAEDIDVPAKRNTKKKP